MLGTYWPYVASIVLLLIIGVYCLIATNNLVRALIGVEVMIKAATLLIIFVGHMTGNMATAQSLVITMIVIEVVVMIVGGGIIMNIFKTSGSVTMAEISKMKG